MKVKTSKGFTLAELLIVMAIITVLAAVAIPTFGRQLETARESSDIELIRSAYNDALTLAVLDATDGVLDGKNGSVAATQTTLPTTGAVKCVTADSKTTYVATLADMEPAAKMSQSLADWQYVNKAVAGVVAPNNVTQKTASLTFAFEIVTTTGNVKLTTITATDGT